VNDYNWLTEGRRHLELKEIPGTATNSTIARWLVELAAWWRDDETPWCGTFVAHCMWHAGYAVPKFWMRAKEWASWGRALDIPVVGCIVVLERNGGGHVGFVVGQDDRGNLLVLGGNQGNKVSIAAFPRLRAVAYRWPTAVPLFHLDPLPVLAGAELSQSEA